MRHSDDRDGRHLERWRSMVRACRHLTDTYEEAEDCASAALLQIMEREEAWQEQSNAFYVTVARRRAVDLARTRARARIRDHRLLAQASLLNEDPAVGVADRDEARWLLDAISPHLSTPARLVLESTANGRSASAAAEDLGMTKRAAESHILRTRRLARIAVASTLVQLIAFAKRLVPRSSATVLAPVVTAASVLAFVLVPESGRVGLRPPSVDRQQRIDAQVVGRMEPTEGKHARHRTRAEQAAMASVQQAAGKVGQHHQPSAVVRQPTATSVTVQKHQSGDKESSTVTVLAHCLRDLEITTNRIGCAGPGPS